MLPITILQSIARSLCFYPVYLNIACLQKSPLEKMKLTIVASLSCFHRTSTFLKPVKNYEINFFIILDEPHSRGDIHNDMGRWFENIPRTIFPPPTSKQLHYVRS
jgi:hypothetical protein